jgi:hypothetical protein
MDESSSPGEQPRRGHETSDANIRSLIISGVLLCCLVIAGLLVSGGVFHYFVGHQGLGPPASPFEDVRMLPPEPRLQVFAPKDLKQYKAEQGEILNSYGWVDQKAGVVRIPIDRAMDILVQKGLPVRGATPPKLGILKSSELKSGQEAGKATQRGCWPQPKRDSLCSPCLSNLNTEHAEHLRDLCVEAFLATEATEALTTLSPVAERGRNEFDGSR